MKILLLEDSDADAEFISEILSEQPAVSFGIFRAKSLSEAISVLEGGDIDVVLSDLGLPDSQGIDTVRTLCRHSKTVPIVVLTGLDDEETGLLALHEGAQDYLVKGQLSGHSLVQSVRYANERNRIEQELIRKNEELLKVTENLRRSNQELERFAYVASHDLQEPLRMVMSFAQLLEKQYKGQLGDDADEYIGFMIEGAKRMSELINDLLDYSRVTSRKKPFAPVDMQEVVATVSANLAVRIKERKAGVIAGPLPTVRADRTQAVQLVQNLVSNAIKFCPPDRTPDIRISSDLAGDEWRFLVTDNGIGIEPRYKDKIFEIFQRLHTREQYPGTGIGLAICRRIVERHGGRIWVDSKEGEGSTFHFTIPVCTPAENDRKTGKSQT